MPRSRDIAIQPASVIVQPFSGWWPMTVASTESAISSVRADADAGLEQVEEDADPGAELGQPVEASARSCSVGVEPALTTGQAWPAARRIAAAPTTASRSRSAAASSAACPRAA